MWGVLHSNLCSSFIETSATPPGIPGTHLNRCRVNSEAARHLDRVRHGQSQPLHAPHRLLRRLRVQAHKGGVHGSDDVAEVSTHFNQNVIVDVT